MPRATSQRAAPFRQEQHRASRLDAFDRLTIRGVRTSRIDARLRHDFPGAAHQAAAQLVDRISTELNTWSIVSETDRVEAAALQYADADPNRLESAVDLALLDWRDLLVSVGDG